MKLPRDISGNKLAKLLKKYNYDITRQTGSHVRLTTNLKGEHHITIPNHDSIKIGTINSILNDVSQHLKMSKQDLIQELFG